MQTKITIRNEAQTCYIDIEGVIGVPEQSQFENADSRVATYETFCQEVERIKRVAATSVVVNIRSTGGDVNDALLIYDALQSLDARITTRCYGYTASAATIIAQAANEGCREISSNTLYLIHNSCCAIEGNASSLEARAELLRKTDERLSHLYSFHSGRPAEEFKALMAENGGEGRWLSAEETIAAGLADKIIDGLIVGSLIPDGEESADSQPAEPQPAEQGVVTAKSDMPQDISKKDIAKAVDTAASALVRFLMRRFAYRWEKWVDSWREKREKKAEKASQSGNEASVATASAQPSAPASVQPTTDAMPQARVERSVVAFDSGQRSYKRSEVKPVEDPSMNRLRSSSNQSAYADDARVFGTFR
ncbi:MAG: Clp protease ClpP [Alistipes sp.]|nr:Clp protease ClpP [Alistipes sp.]